MHVFCVCVCVRYYGNDLCVFRAHSIVCLFVVVFWCSYVLIRPICGLTRSVLHMVGVRVPVSVCAYAYMLTDFCLIVGKFSSC